MSNYANFNRKFWQDNFVVSLTPEEKYFYIYLFTNSHVNTCGVYPLHRQSIVVETGYNDATVDKLLNRFIDYGKIRYSFKTNEVCLINFIKNTYSAMSYQQAKGIMKSLDTVQDVELLQYIDTATMGKTITTYIQNKCNDTLITDKKENINKKNNSNSSKFVKPSIEEIQQYCTQRHNNIDAESFYSFYESKGWKVGNTPMKCWKSAVITWEKRNNNKKLSLKEIEILTKEFNKLYEIYPVKNFYEKALQVYINLFEDKELPSVDELINKVELFKLTEQWKDKTFIPSVYNWLKDKRYKDNLDEIKETQREKEKRYDIKEDYEKENYIDDDNEIYNDVYSKIKRL